MERDISIELQNDDELERDFFKLVMIGLWKKVEEMCKEYPHLLKKKVTAVGDIALHVAVCERRADAVKNLAGMTDWRSVSDYKSLKDVNGSTPLHLAARDGDLGICKILVAACPQLTGVKDKKGRIPLFTAVEFGRTEVFLYLQRLSPSSRSTRTDTNETILHCAIRGGFMDLAYMIIKLDTSLNTAKDIKGLTPLHHLADKPNVFPSGNKFGWFDGIIYQYCLRENRNRYVKVLKEKMDKYSEDNLSESNNQEAKKQADRSPLSEVLYIINKCLLPSVLEAIKRGQDKCT